jgi:hypothetical protein
MLQNFDSCGKCLPNATDSASDAVNSWLTLITYQSDMSKERVIFGGGARAKLFTSVARAVSLSSLT